MNDRTNIDEAKSRLPLPALMTQLGDGDRAKPSARCPFHDDKTPSFSTFQKGDSWFWKCHSGDCGSGDEISYLAKRLGLQNGSAVTEFLKLAGVNGAPHAAPPKARHDVFNWSACVDDFTEADAVKVAEWRGLSPDFVRWLHAAGTIGIFEKLIAFPNHDEAGEVVSAHCRLDSGKWIFKPSGRAAAPLCFGDLAQAGFVLCFESQWDAFATMDRLGWHLAGGVEDTAVLITRGAANGKLCRGKFKPDATCYAFKQNDEPTAAKPIPAGDVWLADIVANAGCRVLNVATPAPHKDPNDWTQAGATKADIEGAISRSKVCKVAAQDFDKITSRVRKEIIKVLSNDKLSAPTRNREVAQIAARALAEVGRLFYHAERRDFDSCMFFDGHAKRLLRIRSDAFGSWLSEWLGINRADPLYKAAFAEIETAALSEVRSTPIQPETFWASRKGAIYLSNGDGHCVKITGSGVALVDNGTDGVLFPAGRTLAPWKITTPQDPFATCQLFRDAHCGAEHGKHLLRLWLYSLPSNPKSKPPLCLPGPIGSGKTRTLKGFAEFLGIPFFAHKVDEAKESDFWPACDAGGLFVLDNADTRCRWLADALANAATDGCSQQRKLYTNSDIVTLRARAWLSITTAVPTFANDAGLADRLIVVRMDRRDDQETSDELLGDEIQVYRDAGLSHLAGTLSAALADTAPTPAGLNKRHPDFAGFAVRIGRALGKESETITALQTAEADKSAFCLENDTLGVALLAFMRCRKLWRGTAAELLEALKEVDHDMATVRDNGKPEWSSKRIAKRLSALWPHLQAAFTSAKREEDRKGFLVFRFTNDAAADIADIESTKT